VYRALLRLYPRDYRAAFAAEMSRAFGLAAGERRGQGRAAYLRFVLGESIGLIGGAASEWVAKLTTSRFIRGRSLPDRLKMRPPGVSWESFYK
jgi:hypothetical protein